MSNKAILILGLSFSLAACSGFNEFWGERNPVKQQYPAVPAPAAEAQMSATTPTDMSQQPTEINAPHPTAAPMPGQSYHPYYGSPQGGYHTPSHNLPSYPSHNQPTTGAPPSTFGTYNQNKSSNSNASSDQSNNDVSSFEQKVLSRDKGGEGQLQSYRMYIANNATASNNAKAEQKNSPQVEETIAPTPNENQNAQVSKNAEKNKRTPLITNPPSSNNPAAGSDNKNDPANQPQPTTTEI